MELRVLRYFLAVAEEGNITWAAQLLRISQPTLSRQLKQLEEELGVTLFERGSHTITLTEEGRMLRECAQTKSIRVPAHRHYKALVSDGSRKPPVGGTRIVDPAESQGCAAAVPGAHARTQSAAELVRAIRRSGESEHRRLLFAGQQRRRHGDQWTGDFPRARSGHVLPGVRAIPLSPPCKPAQSSSGRNKPRPRPPPQNSPDSCRLRHTATSSVKLIPAVSSLIYEYRALSASIRLYPLI